MSGIAAAGASGPEDVDVDSINFVSLWLTFSEFDVVDSTPADLISR